MRTSPTSMDLAGAKPSAATARRNPFRSVIAIDGPAAAGKTTVAQAVAERLGAMLFDTGTLYRAVTLAAVRTAIPDDDEPALARLAESLAIDVSPPSRADGRLYDVSIDGEDVTWAIRDRRVEEHVSAVAAHPGVRNALLPVQRRIAGMGPLVMVGRDITTVVVPEAGLKIYLDASAEERARRRCRELTERGVQTDYQSVLDAMRSRDAIDAGRTTSPLRAAPDAVVIDTDGRSVEEVVDQIVALARASDFRDNRIEAEAVEQR